jgi:SpoIID/LytB domain protein
VKKMMTVLSVALMLAFLPAPALAGRTVVITGGGWGHGLGMSQYGSYGMALNGRSADGILEHYYSGASVQWAHMPDRLRVGLLQGRRSISATSSTYLPGHGRVIFKVAKGMRIASGGTGSQWRVVPSSTGRMRLYKNGNKIIREGRSAFGSPRRPIVAQYEQFGSLIGITEKANRYAYGRMDFGTYRSSSCGDYCLRLVLRIPMQKYLFGLGEVPASWPQASLRSQAIAGRTYAFEKFRRSGQHRYPCDCAVYDSTYDQAYIGDAKRTGSGAYWDDWQEAVIATRSEVILYNGAPIQAFYSSSSGGHTESNENVWGGTAVPYLRGVPDAADAVAGNPNHTWRVVMSWLDFSSRLNSTFNTGAVERFQLVKPFGVSGRVTVVKGPDRGGVRIVGSKRTVRASGTAVKSALSLKDSLFRVEVRRDGANLSSTLGRAGASEAGTGSISVPPPSWQTKASLSYRP